MDSLQRRHRFDPQDLDLIDRVYEVACRLIEARDLYCEQPSATQQEEALRKMMFACASTGRLDFDTLCDKVLAGLAETVSNRRAA
jgi:hypothetical protein